MGVWHIHIKFTSLRGYCSRKGGGRQGGGGVSNREELLRVLVDVLDERGRGMEVGLVRAVLQEVDGMIARELSRMPLESVWERTKKTATEQGSVR